MKTLVKASLIGGCYATTITFGLAASVKYHVQTPATLSHTVEQIQQAVVTGQQPEISLGELRRHPFSPLFLLMALASGTVGSLLSICWLWNLDFQLEKETEQPSFPSLPPSSVSTAAALPQAAGAINFQPQQKTQAQPAKINDPRNLPFEQRRQWLWQLLSKETPWFLQLLEATPILFYGEQRAGKSQPALALLIIRRLFLNHEWEIINPHGHLENWSQIAKFIPSYGKNHNYLAINERIASYKLRLGGNSNPYSVLWDEFTSYKDQCDAEWLLKSFMQETDKTAQFPILVSHGDTQEYLGGTQGTCASMRRGCIKILVVGKRTVTGRTIPSGKALVTGLTKDSKGEGKSIEVSLPQWLQGQQILEWFPELQQTAAIEASNQESEVEKSTISNLNKLYKMESAFPAYEQSSLNLSPQLKAIWEYVKKRGETLTARDLQRASLKALQEVKAEEIKKLLEQLEALGLGTFDGSTFTPNLDAG